jgi:hypothetical protein
MSDAPNPPTQDEEPAEGSRETVEQAERQVNTNPDDPHPEAQSGG